MIRGSGSVSGLVTALVWILALGCEPAGAPAQPPAPAPLAADEAELERLFALGYVDSSSPASVARDSGVVKLDLSRAYPGYSLYAVEGLCKAVLIDLEGREVNTWAEEPCRGHWHNAELLRDGRLLVVDGGRGVLATYAWSGELIGEQQHTNLHHDVEMLPSGEVSFLRFKPLPDRIGGLAVVDCEIVDASPSGRILRALSLYRPLRDNDLGFALLPRKVRSWGQADRTDLLHANSLEWMRRYDLVERDPIYAIGNVLVSIRHQDAVVIVDAKAGRLLWAWGQGELSGPHDATLLDDGHILVFDNGVSRGWSRVVEVDPLTNRIVWEYRGDQKLFTRGRGSAQRLPNGNTLIAVSDAGRLLEVTREGDIVWEFLNPDFTKDGPRWHFARVKRYEKDLIERLEKGDASGV